MKIKFFDGKVNFISTDVSNIELKCKDGKLIHIIENMTGVNIDWGAEQ